MHTREGSRHAAFTTGLRSVTFAAAICFTMTSIVPADEPAGAFVDAIPGKPLWRYASTGPLQPTGFGNAAGDKPAVTLGRSSSSVKKLAAQVLGERYPCSAVALTLFEPPASRDGRWEIPLQGVPTSATVTLIANGAQDQQIAESIYTLGGTPYDPDRPLVVSVTVTTRPLAADVSLSTIQCTVIDSENGAPLQTIEPTIEFLWRPAGARLLGVYRDT